MRYSLILVSFLAYALLVMATLNQFPGSFTAQSLDSVSDIIFGFAAIIVASVFASAYYDKRRPELSFLTAGAVVLALSKITQIYLQQWSASTNYTVNLDSQWALSGLATLMGCLLIIVPIWRASE